MCNNAELNGLELMYVSMHTHKLILKGTTVFLLEVSDLLLFMREFQPVSVSVYEISGEAAKMIWTIGLFNNYAE